MHKMILNECIVSLALKPTGPILVKERGPQTDEERSKKKTRKESTHEPDMLFVRIMRNGRREPFLPGSSLKGVLRSQAEKIARTLNNSPGCCDPFLNEDDGSGSWELSCSKRFSIRQEYERKKGGIGINGPTAYADSCPICKLFGCGFLRSRIDITDAYIDSSTNIPEGFLAQNGNLDLLAERVRRGKKILPGFFPIRTGIAIDRFTGSVGKGKLFNYETWEKGNFNCEIRLRNFELWQLGLLVYLVRDLDEERMSIGYSKRRGLGKIKGIVNWVKITYYGPFRPLQLLPEAVIWGVGLLAQKSHLSELAKYGFRSENESKVQFTIKSKVALESAIRPDYRHTDRFDGDDVVSLWKAVAPFWNKYIERYTIPQRMSREYIKGSMEEVGENV